MVNTVARNKATAVVQEWLKDTANQIVTVDVNGQLVSVSVEGTDPVDSVNELALKLRDSLRHPVTVSLRVIPTITEVSQSLPSP